MPTSMKGFAFKPPRILVPNLYEMQVLVLIQGYEELQYLELLRKMHEESDLING
jgi:hypothetical protein